MKILALVNNDDEGRTGTFTTGILSVVEDKKIAVFFTGRNHAGENMAELLGQRDSQTVHPYRCAMHSPGIHPKSLRSYWKLSDPCPQKLCRRGR